jgi:hypothetical protein
VVCDRCGATGWLKTCRWRDGGEQTFVLCDGCWLPLAGAVWIIPGGSTVTARCDECDGFMNPRELAVRRALVKEVYRGTCATCAI